MVELTARITALPIRETDAIVIQGPPEQFNIRLLDDLTACIEAQRGFRPIIMYVTTGMDVATVDKVTVRAALEALADG